jgi:hypothetical protein
MTALPLSQAVGRMILKPKFKRTTRRPRRSMRHWLNTSVQVFTGSGRIDALGINLSDGGMCLFTVANLDLGSEIQIEFLPPQSEERVRVAGTVRHRALYLYGIEFLHDTGRHQSDRMEISPISGEPVPS